MIECSIDSLAQRVHPCWLGKIDWSDVHVEAGSELWAKDLKEASDTIKARFSAKDALDAAPPVRATRQAYTAYGVNPKRYAPASEAMVKRILGGKPLPSINTMVDLNNVLSLKTLCPVGSYNRTSLQGRIQLRIGGADDRYLAIGNDTYSAEGFPILVDELGPFGGASRDSQRSMVSPGVTEVVTIIYAFLDPELLSIEKTISGYLKRGGGRLGQAVRS